MRANEGFILSFVYFHLLEGDLVPRLVSLVELKGVREAH